MTCGQVIISPLESRADKQRFYQLEKHLSKPGHVYRKFGTGNYDSLWSEPKADGRDPRQQLLSWWEKEYCAKRMKLVVIGKDSIETLEKWVKEKFEAVPVRTEGAPAVGPKGQRVVFEESPTNPDRMGVSLSFTRQSVMLTCRWLPLPNQSEMIGESKLPSPSQTPITSTSPR